MNLCDLIKEYDLADLTWITLSVSDFGAELEHHISSCDKHGDLEDKLEEYYANLPEAVRWVLETPGREWLENKKVARFRAKFASDDEFFQSVLEVIERTGSFSVSDEDPLL